MLKGTPSFTSLMLHLALLDAVSDMFLKTDIIIAQQQYQLKKIAMVQGLVLKHVCGFMLITSVAEATFTNDLDSPGAKA